MSHAANDALTQAFPKAPWLLQPMPHRDAVGVLSQALGAGWSVERTADCDGEVSIIALCTHETNHTPAFILYEKDGQTQLATIRGDDWESARGFASFQQALAALISMATTASGGANAGVRACVLTTPSC